MRNQKFFLALVLLMGVCTFAMSRGMLFSSAAAESEDAFGLVLEKDVAASEDEDLPDWIDSQSNWEEMTAALEKQASRFQGRMGIYFKDLKTGREWTYHADEVFPSASLIKVPIMLGVVKKIRDGQLKWDDTMVIQRSDKRGGSGTMRRMRKGSVVTIRHLVERMITESDNTAATMLIRQVGYDYLASSFAEDGLKVTNITEAGMSLSNTGVATENFTTPAEMASIYERLYRGEIVSPEHSREMLDILKKTRNKSRFAKRMPRDWQLAHKTGMLRLACHDTGIFYAPKGDYVLTVLTWRVPDYFYAANYISKVAKTTFKYYNRSQKTAGISGRTPRKG